jgi:hypothetical protein
VPCSDLAAACGMVPTQTDDCQFRQSVGQVRLQFLAVVHRFRSNASFLAGST